MIESMFPKALIRKEWYLHRTHALLVLLLIVPSVVRLPWARIPLNAHAVMSRSVPTSPGAQIANFFNDGGASSGTTGIWAGFVVMVFAILMMHSERRNHALWFSFTSPVSRRQMLRVKWGFGTLTITLVYACLAIYLLVLNDFAQSGVATELILSWSVTQIIALIGIFSLALLMAVVIGNPLMALGLTYIIAKLPVLFSWVMPNSYYELIWRLPHSWIYDRYESVITPWTAIGGGRATSLEAWIMVAWFAVFSGICYWLSQVLFGRIQGERLFEMFPFPRTRMWGTLLLAFVGGLAVVDATFHTVPKLLKLAVLLVVAVGVLLWLSSRRKRPAI